VYYYYDWTMLLLIPGMLIAMYAQARVKSAFARYLKVASAKGTTGAAAARELLGKNGITDVSVHAVRGTLSDHYDPGKKKLFLSGEVYNGTSLASLAVAAHETGHAVQHKEHYPPLALRSAIVPVARIGSTLALPLCILGMFFSLFLTHVGIALFAGVVIFQLATLPVEFDASRRAMVMLESYGMLGREEIPGASSVLRAAALTYVAALMVSLLQLLRLVLLFGGRRRRN
jgi:Zn-dependent membrane protease YugP